jgi:hypothetical protein
MVERPLVRVALDLAGVVVCTALAWLVFGREVAIIVAAVFAGFELLGLPGTVLRVRRRRVR